MWCVLPHVFWAQPIDTTIYKGIQFDAVMVKEVRSGFNVAKFINTIKDDTTFYKAFKTLRILNYTMYNDIQVEDKKGNTTASYNSITHQHVKAGCRTMSISKEKVSGDFYKKKKEFRYYTAKLYAHLFFTEGKICGDNNIVGNKRNLKGSEKYEEQLRTLIFNPGQRIKGIPGIGDNVAIFENPYYSMYKFKLGKMEYNGEECYVFSAYPKEKNAEDVVINELKTWIRVKDNAIVARRYALSYNTLLYDFDVIMDVKLKKHKNNLVPYEISYKGNWDTPLKSREKASFTAIFTDFD